MNNIDYLAILRSFIVYERRNVNGKKKKKTSVSFCPAGFEIVKKKIIDQHEILFALRIYVLALRY